MLHVHKLSVAFAIFGWTALAQTASQKPESWLALQSVHVVGDAVGGFRKSCVIVYPNGEYHRERRWQTSRNGRAQFEWESPEVFEATLTPADLAALQAILEAPEFSSINGVVGGSRSRMYKLVLGPQGAVIPHENIEFVTVAVARSNALKVFELADIDVARRQESLSAFLNWINATEHSQAQRLAASQATNCTSLAATGSASLGGAPVTMGVTAPKAIYAPGPQPPHGAPKPQPVLVELLINPDGSVTEASLQGRTSPDVAQSVLDAVRKWKFQPARLLGVPIAQTLHLKIEFRGK